MKVVMHNKAILVEVERPATKTAGGIDIPEEAQQPNMFGKVVARGVHRSGIYDGCTVLFTKAQSVDARLLQSLDPNKMYVMVEYPDIYASIELEPEDIKEDMRQQAEEIVQANTEHELVN